MPDAVLAALVTGLCLILSGILIELIKARRSINQQWYWLDRRLLVIETTLGIDPPKRIEKDRHHA